MEILVYDPAALSCTPTSHMTPPSAITFIFQAYPERNFNPSRSAWEKARAQVPSSSVPFRSGLLCICTRWGWRKREERVISYDEYVLPWSPSVFPAFKKIHLLILLKFFNLITFCSKYCFILTSDETERQDILGLLFLSEPFSFVHQLHNNL